jgi:hypothetical protein
VPAATADIVAFANFLYAAITQKELTNHNKMSAVGQHANTLAELDVYHVHSYRSRVLAGCAPDRDMLQEIMIWVIENSATYDVKFCHV